MNALLLAALALASPADSGLRLVETAPVETVLGSEALPEAADVWLETLRGAQHGVNVAQFYVSDQAPSRLTPILEELERAGARGVRVRVLAEKKFHATYPEELDRLGAAAGVEVRLLDLSERTGGILHAKYFTVDGRALYLGSQNFDWRSLEHIQELGVLAESADLTRALDEVFELDWALAAGETPPALEGESVRDVALGELRVTPVFSPRDLCPREGQWDLPRLVELIDGAERTVRVQLLSYKTKGRDGTWFGELDSALRAAASRGVRVRMVLADWSKSRGTIEGLQSLQALPNIEVTLVSLPEWSGGFVPFSRVVHAKYLVVDGAASWIGTSNWSGDYFHASRNVGLIVEGASFAKQLEGFFDAVVASPYAETVDPCASYEPPRRQ